jgi:hypothetical protein
MKLWSRLSETEIERSIDLPEGDFGLREQPFDLILLRDIGLYGDRHSASADDLSHDLLGPCFAGTIVDDDRSSLSRQLLGDSDADSFRCASDDRDSAGKFLDGSGSSLLLLC